MTTQTTTLPVPATSPARTNPLRMALLSMRYSARIVAYRARFGKGNIFQVIHDRRLWGATRSGGGSTLRTTAHLRAQLVDLFAELGVRSLLDAPCGDFEWMREIVDRLDSYTGLDIVPALIEDNLRRFTAPNLAFGHADITRDELPRADLILCRDCMVHLSNEDVARCLRNLRRSGAKHLLATTYPGRRNTNILTGMWRPLDLQAPPFSLPPPLRLLRERTTEAADYSEKSLGLWRTADLPSD